MGPKCSPLGPCGAGLGGGEVPCWLVVLQPEQCVRKNPPKQAGRWVRWHRDCHPWSPNAAVQISP